MYDNIMIRNLEAYNRMKHDLLKKYRNKVVAIKDGEVVGIYDDEMNAFEDMVRRYGLVPMFLRRVRETDERYYIYGPNTSFS